MKEYIRGGRVTHLPGLGRSIVIGRRALIEVEDLAPQVLGSEKDGPVGHDGVLLLLSPALQHPIFEGREKNEARPGSKPEFTQNLHNSYKISEQLLHSPDI